jgi:hypothetical protein
MARDFTRDFPANAKAAGHAPTEWNERIPETVPVKPDVSEGGPPQDLMTGRPDSVPAFDPHTGLPMIPMHAGPDELPEAAQGVFADGHPGAHFDDWFF